MTRGPARASLLRQCAADGLRVIAQLFTVGICLIPVQLVVYLVDASLPPDYGWIRLVVFLVLLPVVVLWLGFSYPRVQRNLWGHQSQPQSR